MPNSDGDDANDPHRGGPPGAFVPPDDAHVWAAIKMVYGPEAMRRVRKLGLTSRQRWAETVDEFTRDWKKIVGPVVTVVGLLWSMGLLQPLLHAAQNILVAAFTGGPH